MNDVSRFHVRKIPHRDGQVSHWIYDPTGELHRLSLEVLKSLSSATQETYAYSLIDHLNWLSANNKSESAVTLVDLQRYMNAITGKTEGVFGAAWRRADQRPLGPSAANNVATVVKAYYLALPKSVGVSRELKRQLAASKQTRGRGGRIGRVIETNPLAPPKSPRRPRFMPDEVVEALFQPGVLTSARDVMIVTWLHEGGLRVGGLCGLRSCDLHLQKNHPCGQREQPHIHIVGRDDNPNRARAKAYSEAHVSHDGFIVDGVIRTLSPDMISTYYGYLLDEYSQVQHLTDHEQVLVHINGKTPGAALTTAGVRKMLNRACHRAGLNARVTPHAFRHKAAAAFYEASDFNAEMVAQEMGWANEAMVTQLYGKSANRAAMKILTNAWDGMARPKPDPHLAECTQTEESRS